MSIISPASPPIVLASTSPYRRALLSRLQISFTTASPEVDESAVVGESGEARALRLAEEKAVALAERFPDSLILGGDQTIACGDVYFDKPLCRENAIAQLKQMRGQTLDFYTALALNNTITGECTARLVTHHVRVRQLSDEEIIAYVQKEPSFNCGGGAQIEGLGIALMADIQGGDPTALIGISLIDATALLSANGVAIL